MTRTGYAPVSSGTPADLVAAARLGARIAARKRSSAGHDKETIRRQVIARFRQTLADHPDYECETLMMAVQQGIADVLD